MKWNYSAIGEHCEVTSSKRIFFSEYVETGVPFYRSKEIIEKSQGQPISEPLFISREKYQEILHKFGVPVAGDVLLTSVGTIGIPYVVKPEDHFYFKDGNLTWFRNFDKKLLPDYLFYWINSAEGQGLLNNATIGSSQKALTISTLKQIKMPLPPIELQTKIVSFLSAYDELIENNQNQIKLLEEAAQRLYKEWFVDLRFPGHETTPIVDGVPEGWKMQSIGEIADINKRILPQDYPFNHMHYVDLGSVRCGCITEKKYFTLAQAPGRAKRVARDGDIIWGMVRPNLKSYALVLSPSETDVFSTGFSILSAKKVPFSFLYCSVTTDDFVGYLVNCTNGAAYPAVKPEHFAMAFVVVPDHQTLSAFNAIVEPMYRKVYVLSNQIVQAEEARNRLLSKLMNGELEVTT